MAAKKKRTTTKALSEKALFDLAADFESSKERVKKYENDPVVGWRSIQSKIVAELQRRKVKSLTASGSLTKVTLVAPETVVYDDDAIWAELTPAKRRLVFDRQINLSALPKDVQVELLKSLTASQRKKVVSHRLNVDRLAEAVQDGKVPVELVSEHSEIKASSPYISVSHGSAE